VTVDVRGVLKSGFFPESDVAALDEKLPLPLERLVSITIFVLEPAQDAQSPARRCAIAVHSCTDAELEGLITRVKDKDGRDVSLAGEALYRLKGGDVFVIRARAGVLLGAAQRDDLEKLVTNYRDASNTAPEGLSAHVAALADHEVTVASDVPLPDSVAGVFRGPGFAEKGPEGLLASAFGLKCEEKMMVMNVRMEFEKEQQAKKYAELLKSTKEQADTPMAVELQERQVLIRLKAAREEGKSVFPFSVPGVADGGES
jgi:hypothetical protein